MLPTKMMRCLGLKEEWVEVVRNMVKLTAKVIIEDHGWRAL